MKVTQIKIGFLISEIENSLEVMVNSVKISFLKDHLPCLSIKGYKSDFLHMLLIPGITQINGGMIGS